MKPKLIIIAIAAVTLLSFAFTTSNKKAPSTKSNIEESSGFALQDTDQF